MNLFISSVLLLVSIPTVTADCCKSFRIGKECCNIFGCNCAGPCWNAGCKTDCEKNKFPGRPISCPDNHKWYNCCLPGEQCKHKCDAQKEPCCCSAGKGEQVISISDVKYDFAKAIKDQSTAVIVSVKYRGSNYGDTSNPVGKVSSSITYTQTTSWQLSTATKVGVSVKVTAGIPKFVQGEITATVEETFTYGQSESKSVASNISIDTGGDSIPPYSRQSYQFDANMFSFKIPYTATVVIEDQCGTQTPKTEVGIATLDGVAQFVEGDFTKLVGPSVPIECESPFDTPIKEQPYTNFCSMGSDSCQDNALCIRFNLVGKDCSCVEGEMNPCCAYAEAHPICLDSRFNKDAVLCPSPKGNFHPCCAGVSARDDSNSIEIVNWDVSAFATTDKKGESINMARAFVGETVSWSSSNCPLVEFNHESAFESCNIADESVTLSYDGNYALTVPSRKETRMLKKGMARFYGCGDQMACDSGSKLKVLFSKKFTKKVSASCSGDGTEDLISANSTQSDPNPDCFGFQYERKINPDDVFREDVCPEEIGETEDLIPTVKVLCESNQTDNTVGGEW